MFENFENEEKTILKPRENLLFQFGLHLKVSWMFCWNFHIIQNTDSNFSVKKIVRRFKIKWWLDFHETNCCPKIDRSWIQEQRNIGITKLSKKDQEQQANFLTEKSRLLTILNQCKTLEELTIIFEEIANLVEASS